MSLGRLVGDFKALASLQDSHAPLAAVCSSSAEHMDDLLMCNPASMVFTDFCDRLARDDVLDEDVEHCLTDLHQVLLRVDRGWLLTSFHTNLQHNTDGGSGDAQQHSPRHPAIDECAFMRLTKALHQLGTVTQFEGREDIGYQRKDFHIVDQKATLVMKIYQLLFTKIYLPQHSLDVEEDNDTSTASSRARLEVIIHSFLVAAEHSNPHLWTSEESMKASKATLDIICQTVGVESLTQLLCGAAEGKTAPTSLRSPLFQDIFKRIKPRLTRSSWKQHPSVSAVFSLCLFSVPSPWLGDRLDSVLPPSLLIVDDHEARNKVLGIRCLQHIAENTSATELKWFGRADVIYDSLQRLTYSRDVALIDALHPCLLRVLRITEGDPKKNSRVQAENRYDVIFQRLLMDMEMENQIVLRRTYCRHLASYISALGIGAVRHYKRLLRVFGGYLEVYDGPEETARLSALSALRVLLTETWPRVPHHSDTLLRSLVKLMYDVSVDRSLTPVSVKDRMLAEVKECLVLVKRADPEKVRHELQAFQEDDLNQTCRDCLSYALSS